MQSVKRTKKPQILVDYERQWTVNFLMRLNEKKLVSDVEDRWQKCYAHQEIRSALQDMYHHRCCYCTG